MKQLIKSLILIVFGLINISEAKSQEIEIGDTANKVKDVIEWATKDHDKTDPYGNTSYSYYTSDVKYNNGQISDVIQCFQNEFYFTYYLKTNYCKHYVMENNKLSYILTEFESISFDTLKANYDRIYSKNKFGELYFQKDFENYSKIYLASNGHATVELRKTIISELPLSIQSTVNSKLTTLRQEKTNKQNIETETKITQEDTDQREKQFTILTCEDFSDGVALVGANIKYNFNRTQSTYTELYGYINDKGEYAIIPKYEKAFSFSDSFALVEINSQDVSPWKFINNKGEDAFNKKFNNARSFSEGFAAVKMENGGYGFIDKTGNLISQTAYQEVGDFKEGLARVEFQDKWGFIDKTGKEVIYPQFTDVRDFSDGLAMVSQIITHYTQYSYIDRSGNIAIKLDEGDEAIIDFKNKNFASGMDDKVEIPLCDFNNGVAMIVKRDGEITFIDKTGKAIIKPKDGASNCLEFFYCQFVNNFSIGEACGKFGFLDKKGKWCIKPLFDNVGNFHNGLAKVEINSNWGFIDSTGNVVINKEILKAKTEIQTSAPFDNVSDFSEGFAIVQTRNKFGYIDETGNWVVKPELINAKPFNNGLARVVLEGRKGWNYIDKTGKILFTNFL